MKAIHMVIHGKVQGVWFRAWTRDTARELGVAGWVRNMPGGTVEVLAQAEGDRLDVFLERLHEGPPLARTSRIDVSPADIAPSRSGFAVRA